MNEVKQQLQQVKRRNEELSKQGDAVFEKKLTADTQCKALEERAAKIRELAMKKMKSLVRECVPSFA